VGFTLALVFALVAVFQSSEAATQTMTATVTASADDARVPDGGSFTSTERTAMIGAGNGSQPNVAGFRFTGMTIPQGSIINSVEFSMVKGKTTWSRLVVYCVFEAQGNAASFSVSSTPAQRTPTTAVSQTDSNVRRSSGKRYAICQGAQLAAALQQVISRPDWKAGNAVAIIAAGPASPAMARTDFMMSDAGSRSAPQLKVSYTLPQQVPPTNTPTAPSPTATTVPPTATPSPTHTHTATATTAPTGTASLGYGTWTPGPLDTCTKAIHDSYFVIGADGKKYATWHPAVDPATGCSFGHEHGADPRTSQADNTLPAFGYAAEQMGMLEPHVGFKVFVIDRSVDCMEGGCSPAHYRFVLHMGTSGVKRYTEQFHSAEYDYVAADGTGREFHINLMGNTGNGTGSTCTSPRDGGKDFSTVGCNDTYEIWNSITLGIMHPNDPYVGALQSRLWVTFSMAVFDPVTTRDPNDNTRLLYSQNHYYPNSGVDPLSTAAAFHGCDREAYGGPNYFNNAGQPTVYWTDAHGQVVPQGTAGAIQQMVAAVDNGSAEIFKFRAPTCSAGVHAPN
jgi:hypothetical protein